MNNNLLIIGIILSIFLCISTANAENIDSAQPDITTNDEIIYEEITYTEEVNASNCECCSLVIQEDDETVFAFRQDGPLSGNGVEINPQAWNGINIIKQEIDTPHEYFFHGIITENGWVVGEGGSQYNDSSRTIEQIAATMINNNDISANYLNQIRNILSRYNYGHFIIKSPDGKYGIAFANTYLTGTLQKGECLVVPNYYSSYYKVNYKNYGSNPVDAIIVICSRESSGHNRRNIYSYDYKKHSTANGVYYGVDIYATNDNGRNVGMDTAKITTHFSYNGQYYPASTIPQNPGKLYVATHIFESQREGIELIRGPDYGIIGEDVEAYYRIKNIYDAKTIIFNLGNFEFVKAETSHGSFNYNSNQHTLNWEIPAAKDSKDIIITVKPKARGDYTIHSYIQAMSEQHDLHFYATEYGAVLKTTDVDKFKGGSQRLNIELTDKFSRPLVGEDVIITINGNSYTRKIDSQGHASLAINLGAGEYEAAVKYDGIIGSNETAARITVKTTIFGNDTEKYFKNDTQFYATFLDSNGKPLKNSNVNFNINGVIYTRSTDENGRARLNINLSPNEYIITSINPNTGEQKSNLITVKAIIVENNDLVKYYRNDSQYTLKVLDNQGNPLSGASVTFNINGVFYNRVSDKNGIAKLNINLSPNFYIITAQYNGATVSNSIIVLNRVITQDLSMKYKDGSKFKAVILNEKGGIAPNEVVTFNINGVLYERPTDSSGIARLNINLLPGKYIITTYWNNYGTSNTITIS